MRGFLDLELYLRSHLVPDQDGRGLVEALVLDGPEPTSVTPEDLRSRGVSVAEAYRVARANVRAAGRLRRVELYPDGAPVTVLYGDGLDTATHALWLDEHLDLPEAGALVALPHARALAVHPLRGGTDVRRAIGGLLRYARHEYETRSSPLSDQLYWWRAGELTHQPAVHTGTTITLAPTTDLAAVLDLRR
jgi:hypothetical protein